MAYEIQILNGFVKSFDEKSVTAYVVEGEIMVKFEDDLPFNHYRKMLFGSSKLFIGKQFAIVTYIRPGEMITRHFDSKYVKLHQLFNYWRYRTKLWIKERSLLRLEKTASKILAKLLKITSKS